MERCLLALVAVAIVTSYTSTYVNAQSTLPVHGDEARCQEEYQTHLVTIPLLERIVTSLNGLHQRMELAEEENRKTRAAVTGMKSKQDADSLSGKIQHLINEGSMELEALGTLTEKMTHIKENVKSAHVNVTALIQKLSDQIRNISGLTNTPAPNLGSRSSPAQSCASLTGKPSGLYWIKPDGGGSSNTIQVYCDMETDGGGWTLVYSYRFSNHRSFGSANNAVTPRPTWRVNTTSRYFVPSSTTTPRNETDYGAVAFSLWQEIGSEFLVKSNIANWIKCSEDGGSLVHGRDGSLNCEIVKQIYTSCPAAVPDTLKWYNVGPGLRCGGGQIYFWEGSKTANHPTHDPCGRTSSVTRFPTISNPHGNIYVR